MKILIVDDDLNTVEVIRDSINWKQLGIDDVSIAYNVAGAQDIIHEKHPDIVLCDIEMPRGTGIDLLKWIRENKYLIEFIFLTCHENFEFASTAIEYDAIAYVTKPFNPERTIASLSKAINKINNERHLKEYSQYGEYLVDNQQSVTTSFWNDLMLNKNISTKSMILSEIKKRKLAIQEQEKYRIVLVTAVKSQIESEWDSGYFQYALRNISSEVIFGDVNCENIIAYDTDTNYFLLLIIGQSYELNALKKSCANLVESSKKYLSSVINCYISSLYDLGSLANARENLESLNQNTLVLRGQTMLEGDKNEKKENGIPYTLNYQFYVDLFDQAQQLEIVNSLKKEIERLISGGNLNKIVFDSIYQDFIQIVYSVLYKHGIQAHKLFEDETSKKLSQNASHSTFDLMKWANYVTNSAIDIINQTQKSENVVEKAKNYIAENYSQNIGRNEIAAFVFLTPDYLSKLFKAETGVYLNDYINQFRVKKSKELLFNQSQSVSSIAAQVGFDSISYFSTIFKKITGQTPNEYRKHIKTDQTNRTQN